MMHKEPDRRVMSRCARNTIDLSGNAPAYPRGGDPRRRMRLHHLLVKRRRWSNELDAL
ncbi:hypothetical protein [Micromonospora sp. CA-244673]|uniref:hypothetical protein n=1 Tax=Micromonospora sp. CA-244673 TaxID=3239958 RepID=UPI003D91826B